MREGERGGRDAYTHLFFKNLSGLAEGACSVNHVVH